jgi:hypothetical protein
MTGIDGGEFPFTWKCGRTVEGVLRRSGTERDAWLNVCSV